MSEFRFECAGLSHVGKVREVNEDAWLSRPDLGLWVVADGMGGHDRGDLASRIVVERLADIRSPTDARALRRGVEEALAEANTRLRELAGTGSVMGTTVVLLLVHGAHFAVLWAGDSRAYRWNGELEQLTRDHSLVQDLLDRGEIEPEQVELHPLRNIVARAVGADDGLVLDAVQGELQAGDLFLLCSDGLTKHLSGDTIGSFLHKDGVATSARHLVDQALEAGGSDNVTVVLVEVQAISTDGEPTRPPRPPEPP